MFTFLSRQDGEIIMVFWSILNGHFMMEKVINSCYKKFCLVKVFVKAPEGYQEHGVLMGPWMTGESLGGEWVTQNYSEDPLRVLRGLI